MRARRFKTLMLDGSEERAVCESDRASDHRPADMKAAARLER